MNIADMEAMDDYYSSRPFADSVSPDEVPLLEAGGPWNPAWGEPPF